jgi:hypothetical protein
LIPQGLKHIDWPGPCLCQLQWPRLYKGRCTPRWEGHTDHILGPKGPAIQLPNVKLTGKAGSTERLAQEMGKVQRTPVLCSLASPTPRIPHKCETEGGEVLAKPSLGPSFLLVLSQRSWPCAMAVSNRRDAVFAGFVVFIPLNHVQPILHHNVMLYLVSNTSAPTGIWRAHCIVRE